MTFELSRQAFIATMQTRMIDVSEIAEPVIDIWPYVLELVEREIVPKLVFDENLVEKVYRNIDYTYEHVLLPSSRENEFIVIIVNRNIPSIYGHYKLDLRDEYNL